jgi:hypothetical protein
VTSRFVIDLRVGPRTLELAADLVASVALCCPEGAFPLLLIDNHLPYPRAILQVFGILQHCRRRTRRGRKKHPRLRAPPGLLVGLVEKVRDARGNLLRVHTRALFGRLKDICQQIVHLGIGNTINTAHVERLNGTIRSQQTRLARRTRNGSRLSEALQWSLWLWRDLYNWVRPHGSLSGRTPAMAAGLTETVWTVCRYVNYPVHVGEFQRQLWAEQREKLLISALEAHKAKKHVPTS